MIDINHLSILATTMTTEQTTRWQPPASTSSRINVGTNERIASLAGGALLVYFGLKKFSLIRLSLAGTGGAMLYRGLTGYCPINAQIGRDSSEAGRGTKPIEIETSLTVERPPEDRPSVAARVRPRPHRRRPSGRTRGAVRGGARG